MKRFGTPVAVRRCAPRRAPQVAFASCACVLLAAVSLRAEPRSDTARRESYEAGVAAMKRRDWDEASRLFLGLWQEKRTYDVALMLGQSETNRERFRDAAEFLEYGIRNAVPREKPETLARSRKLLEIAKGRVATLEIRVDEAGADVAVDGNPVGRSPLDHEVYAEPGARLIEAMSPEAVVRETVDVRAGERRVVVLDFPEPPPAPSPGHASESLDDDEPPGSTTRGQARESGGDPSPASRSGTSDATWPLVVGAAAGVAAVTGGAFFLAAAGKEGERKDLAGELEGRNPCGHGQNDAGTLRDCARIEDLTQDKARFRTLGVASFGVAAACAAVTTYLLWPRREEPRSVSLSFVPAPGPAGVSFHTGLSGRFQ